MDPLDYSVIDIEGEDAIAFTNAQFTSDARNLDIGQWQWSSWLDARGRVRALFILARIQDASLRLLLRGGDATSLAGQLRMYLLRSRASIELRPDMHAGDDAPAMPLGTMQVDDASMLIGFDDYAVRLSSHSPTSGAGDTWRCKDIERGFPWLPTAATNMFVSPALSLRRINATSLTKGCYPGQEIATRLHHRGGNKRHLWHIRASGPLHPGDTVDRDGKSVGMVLHSAAAKDGHVGLAVLHESALATDDNGTLTAGNPPAVTLHADRRFAD